MRHFRTASPTFKCPLCSTVRVNQQTAVVLCMVSCVPSVVSFRLLKAFAVVLCMVSWQDSVCVLSVVSFHLLKAFAVLVEIPFD